MFVRGNELCSRMQAGMQSVCYRMEVANICPTKQHAKKNFELSQQLPQEPLITQIQERGASCPHVMEEAAGVR
jgi:hypothetical protein